MKAFVALVWHEIRERRALLAAAAVASLLPLLAPMLPGTGSNSAADIREALMWVMVFSLVPIFALLLGVSFIGRDLSEGRLGFYYAQPMSGTTIWFGKLTAVVGLVWVSQVMMMVPTVALSPDPVPLLTAQPVYDPTGEEWLSTIIFWIAPAVVILLVHSVGIVWRSRSLWMVVDLVALALIAWVGWTAFSPFGVMVAPTISAWIIGSMAVALLIGLLLGGAVQTVTGRVDPRRCHMALTTTLWLVLGATVVVLLSWSWWIRSATLEDIDSYHYGVMGSGEWIGVVGVSQGRLDYVPRFLVNFVDGRNLMIGPAVNWRGHDIELSEDGRRALWTEYEAIDSWSLKWANLEKDRPEARFTGVTLGFAWRDFAVSPAGGRFAVIEDRTLAVYDLDSGQQLVAAAVKIDLDPSRIRFSGENTLRFLASTRFKSNRENRSYSIGSFDLETRSFGETIEVDSVMRWWSHSLSQSEAPRLVQREHPDENRLVLVDPDSQETIADLGEAPHWSDVRIMGDGRIVVLRDQNLRQERDTENWVEVLAADGSLLHRIEIPLAGDMTDGGTVSPDRLLVGVRDWREARERGGPVHATAVVDLTNGRVEEVMEDVIPILGRYGGAATAGAWAVDSPSARLFLGEENSLLLWDPTDGSFETVIPVAD